MKNRLLKAKHWQLFILIFCIPLIFQFVIMASMFANFANPSTPDPGAMFSNIKFIPLILLLCLGFLILWFWSVGAGLQNRIPDKAKLNLKAFKLFLLVPIIYMGILGVLLSYTTNGLFQFHSKTNLGLIAGLFFLVVILHLFSMFCLFYCIYFVARTIKTAELQRPVVFADYIAEFFLVWFFPIGIWIIQPRVNKMAA